MRPFNPNLPSPPIGNSYLSQLTQALARLFGDMHRDIDQLAYGHLVGKKGRGAAAPTTGLWAMGDEYINSEPSELGSASSKYVIRGWICTVGGEPGTWVEQRVLTGN